MAMLILKTGEKAGLEYSVEDGLILGRKLEAPVHVNDVKASREHAKVIAEGARFHMVDLNSTNGTYVNDERISRVLLAHGDRVRIGRTVLCSRSTTRPPPPRRRPPRRRPRPLRGSTSAARPRRR